MSVKVCPECGAEYVLAVSTCADDGAELVVSDTDEMEGEIAEEAASADDREEAGLEGAETADEPSGEQIEYQFGEWDNQSRVLLDQLLTGQGILHLWEGASLVVRAADEEQVDELVEQVDVTTQPLLDPDKEQLVYELSDWSDEKRAALSDSLDTAGIPFGFDETDDLVVHEEQADQVETILDQVDFNLSVEGDDIAEGGDGIDDEEGDEGEDDEEDADEDDGLAAQETLSDLFLGADRLMHDPTDSAGVLQLSDTARAVETLDVPYGFAPGVWVDIVERSTALGALLDEADSDDDDVMTAAKELRDLVRQYV